MAIAPLEEQGLDPRASGSPRLRVIDGGRTVDAVPRRSAAYARAALDAELRRARGAHPSSWAVSPGRDLPTRGPDVARPKTRLVVATTRQPAARPWARTRRRRATGIAVVGVALVLLAMPLRALGAVTVLGQQTPGGVPAGLAPGSTYVVQHGDTLRSIAQRVNAAIAPLIAAELAAETGSAQVVAGEHVRIPLG